MNPVALPFFPYHPAPVASGSVEPSSGPCVCCGQRRGYLYHASMYTAQNPNGTVCPWCIADGSAAQRFDAEFSDVSDLDGVEASTIEEVARRTPGFIGWQQERWLQHCGDAAAFLGPAGAAELAGLPEVTDQLRQEMRAWRWQDELIDRHLAALDRDGMPVAFLFRCRSCGAHLAYTDGT
ncbi:CbrC family protein [Streptomyces sp. TR02-1]|uniref:CbrC family protein n=1 Tax=Streptomyces sp. TR02-1 TaxID=3385977 RepID=UPI00399FAAB3